MTVKYKKNPFIRLLPYLLIGILIGALSGSLIALLLFINIVSQLWLYILIGAAIGTGLGILGGGVAWLSKLLTKEAVDLSLNNLPQEPTLFKEGEPSLENELADNKAKLKATITPQGEKGLLTRVTELTVAHCSFTITQDLYAKESILYLPNEAKELLLTKHCQINTQLDALSPKAAIHEQWLLYSVQPVTDARKLINFESDQLENVAKELALLFAEYNQLIVLAKSLAELKAKLESNEMKIRAKQVEIDKLLKENSYFDTTNFRTTWNIEKSRVNLANLDTTSKSLRLLAQKTENVYLGSYIGADRPIREATVEVLKKKVEDYLELLTINLNQEPDLKYNIALNEAIFKALANGFKRCLDPLTHVSLPNLIKKHLLAKRSAINNILAVSTQDQKLRIAWARYFCAPLPDNDPKYLDNFNYKELISEELSSALEKYYQLVNLAKAMVEFECTQKSWIEQSNKLQYEIASILRIKASYFTDVTHFWNITPRDKLAIQKMIERLERLITADRSYLSPSDFQEQKKSAAGLREKLISYLAALQEIDTLAKKIAEVNSRAQQENRAIERPAVSPR